MTAPQPRDVGGRLILFGVLAVCLGALLALFALLQLALPFLAQRLPVDAPPVVTDTRAVVSAALVYLMLGGVFAWAGVGSMRRRRWTRPVMLTLAWTWLLAGALGLGLVVLALDDLLALPGSDPAGGALVLAVKTFVIGFFVVGGVLLPALFVWVYRDPRVGATCERYDPTPRWSDGRPDSVLALDLALWAMAALSLPLAVRPAVPLFGAVVTGWAGSLLTLAAGAASAGLARAVRRLEPAAWWLTLGVLVLTGASVTWTALVLPPAELYAAMGYPPSQAEALGGPAGAAAVVGACVILTLASVAYMIGIRRHFGRGGAAAPAGQT